MTLKIDRKYQLQLSQVVPFGGEARIWQYNKLRATVFNRQQQNIQIWRVFDNKMLGISSFLNFSRSQIALSSSSELINLVI